MMQTLESTPINIENLEIKCQVKLANANLKALIIPFLFLSHN